MKIILPAETLKDGVTGTEQLVEKITRLIREGAKRPAVRQIALDVVRKARPQDVTAEIQAVWDWITAPDSPPYRMDPVEKQLLIKPEDFKTVGGVDCKKYTIVAGAILEAIGIPVKVRVIDQRRQRPADEAAYHHVYLQVLNKDQGKWVTFDPVVKSWRRPTAGVGSELAHKARRTYMIRPATPVKDGMIVARAPTSLGFSLYDILKPLDFTRADNANSVLAQGAKALLSDSPLAPLVAIAEGNAALVKATAPKPVVAAPPKPPVTKAPQQPPKAPPQPPKAPPQPPQRGIVAAAPSTGLSTTAKVGIAVAGAALLGGVAYALTRKKKRRSNPRRKKTGKRAA